jgi:Virulence protein RhuM family/P22_AR N-terminal domain
MPNTHSTQITTTVPFDGQEIVAIRQDDKVYIIPKEICKNLGIDWDSQRKRIQRDTVLSEGAVIMTLPSKGGIQETTVLPLEYLNGWLFGIDDKKVKPEIQPKIIAYKKDCYNTLFQYFNTGFVLDENRLTNRTYDFDQLYEKVRQIRVSEQMFYEKVKQVFVLTSYDYSSANANAIEFFGAIQNIFHYAVTGNTAAELLIKRHDVDDKNFGVKNFKNTKPTKREATIAKNYLDELELKRLISLSDLFLSYAENSLLNDQKLDMATWITKTKELIKLANMKVLEGKGSVKSEYAKDFIDIEYEKYKNKLLENKSKTVNVLQTN